MRPSGAKAYILQFRAEGGGQGARRRGMTLVTVGKLRPDGARRPAMGHLGHIAEGQDPQAEPRAARCGLNRRRRRGRKEGNVNEERVTVDQDKMIDQDETHGGGSPWDPDYAPDKSLRGCYVGTVERRRRACETRPAPGFPAADDDSWRIGDLWLLERVPGAIRALEATLEFHSGEPWTEERKARWKELTGSDEVSARALCDAVRRALAGQDVREDEREDRPITIEIPGLEPGADKETVERAVADVIRLLRLGPDAKPGEGH